MVALQVLNCSVESFCAAICVILLLQTLIAQSGRETGRWFRVTTLGCLGMLAGNLPVWALYGSYAAAAHWLTVAGMTLFYICFGVFLCGFIAYVDAYMADKRPPSKTVRQILPILGGAMLILALISPFTGTLFSITEDNVYRRGPLFVMAPVIAVMACVTALQIFIRSWPQLNRNERMYFTIYFALPLAGGLLQTVFFRLPMFLISQVLALMLVSMFIHAEMNVRLHVSEQHREQEHITALETLRQKQTALTNETIIALSNAVEVKDRYTNGHSQRVANYSRDIVRHMGWSEEEQQKVYYAALLHDVGKIRVPDTVINKTSRLTDEEFAQIKLHTIAGYYILKEISSIRDFAIGAHWHHERYDGKGYPNGLSGKNIPQIARVIAVADAYDAMTSNRSYRTVMPQDKARAEIERGMGTQFDPQIASVMLRMIDEDIGYRMRQPDIPSDRVILCIDDDPMVHKHLEMIFRDQPMYRLKNVLDGARGLALIKRERVDLVLLDVEMPEMNGFEVLAAIRERYGNLPVIFMTGDKEFGILQMAEQLGINDYLTKPPVPHILLESVQNILLNTRTVQRAWDE